MKKWHSKCNRLYVLDSTGRQRPIGCLIFIGHFLQKSPIINGSLAKNDLRLKASYGSSPPCIIRVSYTTAGKHTRCHQFLIHYCDGMRWLRLVGSLKWWVSFAEYSLFCRALLQKRPTILRSLLIIATSYHQYLIHNGGTGWRRPIWCLKLQVIFRKRATNYMAVLWKMPCKDKASYESWPPCIISIACTTGFWSVDVDVCIMCMCIHVIICICIYMFM